MFHWTNKFSIGKILTFFLWLKAKITYHDLDQELPDCNHSPEGCGLLPEDCLCWTSLFDHPKERMAQGEDFVDFSHPAKVWKISSIPETVFCLIDKIVLNSSIKITLYSDWNNIISNIARSQRNCNSVEIARQNSLKISNIHTTKQRSVSHICCKLLSNLLNKVTIQTTETRIDLNSMPKKQKKVHFIHCLWSITWNFFLTRAETFLYHKYTGVCSIIIEQNTIDEVPK